VAIKGYIDGVIGGSVLGWAHDPERPGARIELEVCVDDEPLGRCMADLEREDLVRAGIGDGRHGFRHPLAGPLTPGDHRIVVQALAQRAVLPLARDHFADQPAVTLTTYASPVLAEPSEPPEPLKGAGGWLFPRSSPERLQRATGRRPIPVRKLHQRADELAARHDRVLSLGADYVVVTVPDKACVYAEHLPARFAPLIERRPGAQLARALRAAPRLRSLDLFTILRDARADGRVFTRTGSELTWLGAFHAYRAIAKELADRGLIGGPMDRDSLARGVLVAVGEGPEYEPELDRRALRGGLPDGLRALILHDGSGERLLPFLGEHFSHTETRATIALPLGDAERFAVVVQVLADGGTFFD
jgi:hypothetical protein